MKLVGPPDGENASPLEPVQTVGEPGFALPGSNLADLGDDRPHAFSPETAFGPAAGDRVGHCEQQIVLGTAVFIAQHVAAPGSTGDLDETLLVPAQQ